LETEFPFLDAYWVSPGRLMAGEYPGSEDPEHTGPRLRFLLEAGVSVFIDLTVWDELEPYEVALAEEASSPSTRANTLRNSAESEHRVSTSRVAGSNPVAPFNRAIR